MMVTIKKLGGSMAIVIPKRLAIDAGLVTGASVDVSPHEDGILLRKHGRSRRPIDQIVKAINSSAYARHRKVAAEAPVGKEIW